MTLKPPHRFARAGEARLHLVGDEQATFFAYTRDGFGHKSGLARVDAVAGEDAVGNEPGEADFLFLHGRNRLPDVGREKRPHLLGPRSIRVGGWNQKDVRIARLGARRRRGDFGHGQRIAVIGVLRHDEAGAARDRACDAQRQVDAFASRACQDDIGQLARQRRQKPFRIGVDDLTEIAAVRVEGRHLPRHGSDDAGMAVAHRRHVVVGVEIARAVGTDEPHAFPSDEIERACVEQHGCRTEHAPAAGDEIGRRQDRDRLPLACRRR